MSYRRNNLYSNPRSQQGEISHQATVVIQCTHDKRDVIDRMLVQKDNSDDYLVYGTPTLDLATCRIDRGDLVFQIGTSSVPRGNILNGAPPVTSYLNGMYWRKPSTSAMPNVSQMTPEDQKRFWEQMTANKISKSIRFMGVSLGATVPNPDDEADEKTQITVRTQGTMAIHHNGPAVLHPGDTLLWRVPVSSDANGKDNGHKVPRFGRSNVKQTLMTVPMRKEHNTIDVALNQAMAIAKDFQLGQDKNILANLKKKLMAGRQFEVDELAASLTHLMAAVFMWGLIQDKPGDKSKDMEIGDIIEQTNPGRDKFSNLGASSYIQLGVLTKNQDFKNALTAVSGGFIDVLLDLERRKIGKVLSYAKPGEKVDVLLGSG